MIIIVKDFKVPSEYLNFENLGYSSFQLEIFMDLAC